MSRAAEAALKMEEYQAKATELSNSASNLGSGTGKLAKRESISKGGRMMPPPISQTITTNKKLKWRW